MATVLVSGSAGFIGGYVVEELLRRGHEVVGIDNLSKYGRVTKSYDDHRSYTFVEGDARDVDLMTKLLLDCDHFIAGAAMIGGISYFHTYAYDLLATNERIIATSCDAAIEAHHAGRLQKVTYLSSSMVFESATSWPSAEGQEHEIPPPISSYGFQKLAVEYFARAAHSQYGLPYTILRPFNCVGYRRAEGPGRRRDPLGEREPGHEPRRPRPRAEGAQGSGPAAPARRRQSDPSLHLWRRPGGGDRHGHGESGGTERGLQSLDGDIDDRPRACRDHLEEDPGEDSEFRYVVDTPFEHDVARRIPATEKAARVLGFEATTSLSDMLDEVIPWIRHAMEEGAI